MTGSAATQGSSGQQEPWERVYISLGQIAWRVEIDLGGRHLAWADLIQARKSARHKIHKIAQNVFGPHTNTRYAPREPFFAFSVRGLKPTTASPQSAFRSLKPGPTAGRNVPRSVPPISDNPPDPDIKHSINLRDRRKIFPNAHQHPTMLLRTQRAVRRTLPHTRRALTTIPQLKPIKNILIANRGEIALFVSCPAFTA